MKWLRFILSHSVFIAICASALCWQAYQLLHMPVNVKVCLLIFFSTLGSYNFYWLISKYHFNDRRGAVDFIRKNVSNFIVLSIAAIGFSYCLYHLQQLISEILVSMALTLLYSVPLWPVKQLAFTRRAGFLKTILLAFTWTYVTVFIPSREAGIADGLSLYLLLTARFLFLLILCIIFDTRDINVDQIRSLRSLATDVSRKTLSAIMAMAFIIYLSAGFVLRAYYEDKPQVLAFFITGIATFAVYRLSQKKQGYFFYYFVVDGLMLFSAAATYIASI